MAEYIKPKTTRESDYSVEVKDNSEVLNTLLGDVKPINFKNVIFPNASEEDKLKPTERQKYVVIVEELLRLATERKWGLSKNQAFVYLFNGAFWGELDREILMKFLGDAAETMTIPKYDARQYTVRENLFKQFLHTGFQPMPVPNGKILINLKNGTFEIDKNGHGTLRQIDKDDFLKYQLPFEYNPDANCNLFKKYLDEVLPDKSAQNVLAEFCGYIFAPRLKLEKALVLYGGGANGKSVFFDIISALLGNENISNYSADALCEPNGYYRAMIANKLVNYSSEIGKDFQTDKFKQLSSGERIEARLPYGQPFEIENYARLIFNANSLPSNPEQTHAYFRRFLIIPFNVTIPTERQDIELAQKIINKELSGVFNWVLKGLDRLITNKGFSHCDAVEKEIETYRRESDSVQMFLTDKDYEPSINEMRLLKDVYTEYKGYCYDDGYRVCSCRTFAERLRNKGYEIKKSGDRYVYIKNSNLPF